MMTMKKCKQFWLNVKGAFSIWFAILAFLGVLTITALGDVLVRGYVINEVQSIMDVAGTSALQSGVDQTKLRLEIFEVNKNVVESNYKAMVSQELNRFPKIAGYQFLDTDVEVFNENWGLGQSSKSRPQAMLDSTMVIVVEGSPVFDLIPGANQWFYHSKSNSYFDVSYIGKTNDGKVELLVRSVSRIVYR